MWDPVGVPNRGEGGEGVNPVFKGSPGRGGEVWCLQQQGGGRGRLIRSSKGSKKGERSHISREGGRGKSIRSQRGEVPLSD